MKRVILCLAAVATAAGCSLWRRAQGPEALRLPGTVEVQEVRLGSRVGGRVAAVHVKGGQLVEAGQVLVTFEPGDLAARRDQAQGRLAGARAARERAEHGPLPEEIAEARAAAEAARARLERARAGHREEQKRQARGDLDAALAEQRQADEELDRARRSTYAHVSRTLPALSEKEQADFLSAMDGWQFHYALSFGLAHAGDPERAALSAAWLVNGKGVAREALAEAARLARDAEGGDTAEVAGRLREVRRRLAALAVQPAPPGQDERRREQLRELAAEEEGLVRRLRQAGGRLAEPAPWAEWADLRRALPADAVFIDVARFPVWALGATGEEFRWGPARYAAWVTARDGPARVIDLGPADRIDAAVADLRAALAEAPADIRRLGEPEAEKALRRRLDALSALVVRPLLPHVGGKPRWYVSPDAALWLVPWEALTLPGGAYVVERHTVSYAVSGRELLRRPQRPPRIGPPLVLADPDFDLGLPEAAAVTRELVGDAGGAQLRGPARGLTRGGFRRLPGTAAEARLVAPSLKALAGEEPRVFLDREALEGVVKAARGPRVLVLATHGFFLPTPDLPPDSPRAAAGWESPLLRCGLLFAGCNAPLEGLPEGADDGVLTGLEAASADLRGCRLVVLSACDTGLGDVRQGEGLAGLRHAFHLAGAEAVLAALWQVPDRQSAQLMAAFCDGLARGRGQAEALREAQLARVKARREQNDAAHPFFWAAFTLTAPLDAAGER
jgi:CHAT domain-containing protein